MKYTHLHLSLGLLLFGCLCMLGQSTQPDERIDYFFLLRLGQLNGETRSSFQNHMGMSDQDVAQVVTKMGAATSQITQLAQDARRRFASRTPTEQEERALMVERTRIVTTTWSSLRSSLSGKAWADLMKARADFSARIESVPGPPAR